VQIGSALASSLGQWVKMPENRLRILVACGAGGGIAATFNAPITGVFFGVEIILREFSVDALFTVMLSAMIADITAIPFLGGKPFLSGFPPGIELHDAQDYLLVAVLAVVAALMGLAFKAVLYQTEDLCDRVWKGRPEWARPVTVLRGRQLRPPHPELTLAPGDRISLLTAVRDRSAERHPGGDHHALPGGPESGHHE